MKTDKIFYTLFQAFPELLFQLIGESAEFAQDYEFKSIEIKELSGSNIKRDSMGCILKPKESSCD